MKKIVFSVSTAVLFGLVIGACTTTQEGVKSNMVSQWTDVNATAKVSTDAAKAVFEAESLKDVEAASTNVDGSVKGKKADGTKVSASIKRLTETTSEVSVTVGTGEPTLGAALAKKIKTKAEGK